MGLRELWNRYQHASELAEVREELQRASEMSDAAAAAAVIASAAKRLHDITGIQFKSQLIQTS
jgi:hypothetical protein